MASKDKEGNLSEVERIGFRYIITPEIREMETMIEKWSRSSFLLNYCFPDSKEFHVDFNGGSEITNSNNPANKDVRIEFLLNRFAGVLDAGVMVDLVHIGKKMVFLIRDPRDPNGIKLFLPFEGKSTTEYWRDLTAGKQVRGTDVYGNVLELKQEKGWCYSCEDNKWD